MVPRLRICFLAPGANVHTQRWVTALKERGHEVLLVTDEPTGRLPVRVFNPYESMGRLARVPKVRAFVAERLVLDTIHRFGPNVVHLHWLNPTFGTLRLVRRLQPVVASVWGSDLIWDGPTPEPRLRKYYRARILAHAWEVTATSRFLAERTRADLPDGREVRVIAFGVDCDRFRPPATRPQRATPVVGFLKHFTPKYGPEILLEAAALLAAQGLEFRVAMHGTKDSQPYRQLAADLKIEDRVTILGRVDHDQVPAALSGFDVYVMPSIYDSESFGVAALEASACGLPVVASRVGGVPETVIDGVTGLLVPPSDPAALAEALGRLLRDPPLRRKLGEAGKEFVLRSYRWEDCVIKMEALYVALVERSAGPPATAVP